MKTLRPCLTLLACVTLPSAAAGQAVTTLVPLDWLDKHLRDPKVVVIHAATQKGDYDAGHIPGARWLAWQAYTTTQNGLATELPGIAALDSALEAIGVSDDSHVVISGGPIQTSARLFFTLEYFGLPRVSMLDGGIDAWRESGRPLEQAAPNAARGSVTLRPVSARLVDATWLSANLENPAVAVLDARVPEFYHGLYTSNSTNPRPGRVPGARNIPFTWLTGELTAFRKPDKLAALFAKAGVNKGTKVVTYCHVGMQATVLYLAARILGYDAALYDGSFEEWSKRMEFPVQSATKQ